MEGYIKGVSRPVPLSWAWRNEWGRDTPGWNNRGNDSNVLGAGDDETGEIQNLLGGVLPVECKVKYVSI